MAFNYVHIGAVCGHLQCISISLVEQNTSAVVPCLFTFSYLRRSFYALNTFRNAIIDYVIFFYFYSLAMSWALTLSITVDLRLTHKSNPIKCSALHNIYQLLS